MQRKPPDEFTQSEDDFDLDPQQATSEVVHKLMNVIREQKRIIEELREIVKEYQQKK